MKRNVSHGAGTRKGSNTARKNMGIRYLGFVVLGESGISNPLSHALVNLDSNPDAWYVISLSPSMYPDVVKGFIPRYFRAIFLASVKAVLKCKIEGGLKPKAVVLEDSVPLYAKVASRLRGWARRDKPGRGWPDFLRVKMAIRDSLFAAAGKEKPYRVVWKGGPQTDAIFFWGAAEFQAMANLERNNPFQIVTIKGLCPESTYSAESIVDLAHTLAQDQYTHSWQNLYRIALLRSMKVEDFIELTGKRCNLSSDENLDMTRPEKPVAADTVQLTRVVDNHRRTLLVGPSGSGKTTILRRLAWRLGTLGQEHASLPLILPMKWFGLFPADTDRSPSIPPYIAFWVRKTIDDNLSLSEIRECDLFTSEMRLNPSRKNMLTMIQQAVEAHFSDETIDHSNVILYVDGLNEVPIRIRQSAGIQLLRFVQSVNKVVIASRPHHGLSISDDIAIFDICALSDEQIVEYLSRVLEHGENIFETQIKNDPSLLSIMRNPFYLTLITENIRQDPNFKVPRNRALLIKDSIQKSIQRKQREEIRLPNHLNDLLVFTVLPSVARWSLGSLTSFGAGRLRPFHQSQECQELRNTETEIFEVIEMAEKYGFLENAGLPAASGAKRAYPEFSHDNIRDYFAALYLQSLDDSGFMRTLPERLEYFAWDEPLLQFLELGASQNIKTDIIEHVLAKDVILGAMCARCAAGLTNRTVLELAVNVADATSQGKHADTFPEEVFKRCPRPISRVLPAYVLGRLPIQFLLDTLLKDQESGSISVPAWFAIADNVTPENLAMLERLWRSLPADDFCGRLGVFHSICKIPSYPAFKLAADIYKGIHGDPQQAPSFAKFLDSAFLATVEYAASPSEIAEQFPLEQYHNEYFAILRDRARVGPEDVKALTNSMARADGFRVADIARLLGKAIGVGAIPILLNHSNELISKAVMFNTLYIRHQLLEVIVDLDPQKGFKILADWVKTESGYAPIASVWSILLRVGGDQAVPHAIGCVSHKPQSRAAWMCVDFLQSWPDKDSIAKKFIDYAEGRHSESFGYVLLGAILELTEYVEKGLKLFDRYYSISILGVKEPVPRFRIPGYPHIDLPEPDPEYWHQRESDSAHRMLPLAVRAAASSLSRSNPDVFFKIVEWSHTSLRDSGKYEEADHELIAVCLTALAGLMKSGFESAVGRFLASGLWTNTLRLLTKDRYGEQAHLQDRLAVGVSRLVDSLPEEHIPVQLHTMQQLFLEAMTNPDRGETPSVRTLKSLIVHVTEKVDLAKVADLIERLRSFVNETEQERAAGITRDLIEKIKSSRGRRFLDTTRSE